MITVHVFLHSKPDLIDDLKKANLINAENSIKENGILQFDVLQQNDDSSRFLLVEVYKDEKAIAQHKETTHYTQWVKNIEPMLSEPRTKIIYKNIISDNNL
jgi:(4S)-4-hydroxy-5-phosphonooxypentane-2,3-dione isomerase